MSKLLAITAVAAVVALGAGTYAWHVMTGPLYSPGDVRAAKDLAEPLTPPAANGPRWLVAPGIELHHFEQGRGTPLLVVHGGPGFAPMRPWRGGDGLAPDYRLVYYHQRGCGLSTRPFQRLSGSNMYADMRELHRTLGLPAQVADIERIRQILGVDRLTLIGHSFGAFLAALYSAEFPERVQALVSIAPADLTVLPNKGAGLFERVEAKLPDGMRPEYQQYLSEYFDFGRAYSRSEAESSEFFSRFAKYYAAATRAAPPESVEAPAPGYLPLAVYTSLGRHHDYSAAFRRVQAPHLVLHGAGDLQPESASRAFAARFPKAHLESIAGAGHFLFDDRPAEFAAILRDFLGRN